MAFSDYVGQFFSTFRMKGDNDTQLRKICIREPILDFLKNETFDTAREVYVGFFDCYRIKLEGDTTFVDLLDTLLNYEAKASTLLNKQRDHYIHSINVFVLGISIYVQNNQYADCFTQYVYDKHAYAGRYDCPQEEFLFRWGIAALFHDIGYPVEITQNQINSFMKFVTGIDSLGTPKPFIDYENILAFNTVEKVMYESSFAGQYEKTPVDLPNIDMYNANDLLTYGICRALPTANPAQIHVALQNYVETMQKRGFVDHAYYSAVIVLKWYGFLAQKSGQSPHVFFQPVLDAASAIFLHNFYPHVLSKAPYNLPPLDAELHPIAYMLLLCDELQDWNRVAYGAEDKKKVLPHRIDIQVCPKKLEIHYETSDGALEDEFKDKKSTLFGRTLNLQAIFPEGVNITTTTRLCLTIDELIAGGEHNRAGLSRPTMELLENMAKQIHANYNEAQRQANANTLPDWDALDDTYKYANIRAAKGVFAKIQQFGYLCRDANLPPKPGYTEVTAFPPESIELLAIQEHDSWMQSRLDDGWTYGPIRDNAKKIHPLLIPYDALDEPEKEKDRNNVRNAFPLLHSAGLKVYEVKKDA